MKSHLSGIAFASFVCLAAGGAHAAILSLEPNPSSITVGEVSTVDLRISDLGDFAPISVSSFVVEVTYDNTRLSFDGATYGSFLGGPFDSVQVPAVDSGSIVTLNEFSFLSNAELDNSQPASFVLASLTFSGLAAGTAQLGFDYVEFTDTTSIFPEFFDPDLEPSSITVRSSETEIPAPDTLLLLAMAVAGLGFLDWRRRIAA